MKKIDTLLIKSFVGPFVVTFMIALFVLIMQFLWVYIDDIMGKGAGILMLTELIAYLSISLFPMALPIAVLISSVMVLGNLGERYELASFKSAGVSLFRIMRPLGIVAFLIAVFSFYCANFLIPITNLQFKSRLHDIRKSKPTLSLEEGVFNDDFQGFTIYLKEKAENGKDIKGVLIYDQKATDGKVNQIAAKRGEMFTTPDQRYFVMNLYDGIQSQEINQAKRDKKKNYSFVRTKFKEYKKVFDLQEFDLKDTNKELFKSHQTMLNVWQLQAAADSIDSKIAARETKLKKHFTQYFHFEKKRDTTLFRKKKPVYKNVNDQKPDSLVQAKINTKPIKVDTQTKSEQAKKTDSKKTTQQQTVNEKPPKSTSNQAFKNRVKKERPKNPNYVKKNIIPQKLDKELTEYTSILETFRSNDHKQILQKASSTARSIKSQSKGTLTSTNREIKRKVKHIYEQQIKFSMAIVCFIFLFVGAPMGAMIQKGGFGYPILISVLFFTLYIMMTIAFEKLVESLAIPALLGAWLPCIILTPLAAFLTYRASQDAKIGDVGKFLSKFKVFRKIIELVFQSA